MEGEIGVLYQGEQVGGFFDWQFNIGLEPIPDKEWASYKVIPPYITARSYWLTRELEGADFRADFFKFMNGQLILMDSSRVELKLPNMTIGKRLLAPIRMRWTKSLSF